MEEKKMYGKFSKDYVDAFLDQPHLARLGTANRNGQPHVTAVWYWWDGKTIWVSGFGSTRKFRDLAKNPRCSILVDVNESKYPLRAVLFEGQAELISEPRQEVYRICHRIYVRYLGEEDVQDPEPQSWIHDPENLVLKLTPDKIFTWA